MSTEKEQKSHAAGWAVTLVLVPVLYVLSIGPVGYLDVALHGQIDIYETWQAYYKPYEWLQDKTPLTKPFEGHSDWWLDRAMSRHDT